MGIKQLNAESWEKALEEFADALKEIFSTPEPDWRYIGRTCLNIGKCFQQLSFSDLAQEYLEKALEASNQVNLFLIPERVN